MISILGDGGHARVVKEALEADGMVCRLVKKGDPVEALFPDHMLAIGVGEVTTRVEMVELFGRDVFVEVVHPRAVCLTSKVGIGTQILAGAMVMVGADLDDFVIVNTGAQVDHDCFIEEHAFIGPGAVLCGHVEIGQRAFIGANATLLPGVKVGSGTVVGAGSVVIGDIPSNVVCAGNPARIHRQC